MVEVDVAVLVLDALPALLELARLLEGLGFGRRDAHGARGRRHLGEIWGDTGRYQEIWGRYGEIWGRCTGDMGGWRHRGGRHRGRVASGRRAGGRADDQIALGVLLALVRVGVRVRVRVRVWVRDRDRFLPPNPLTFLPKRPKPFFFFLLPSTSIATPPSDSGALASASGVPRAWLGSGLGIGIGIG